jgi:hypothetical protein
MTVVHLVAINLQGGSAMSVSPTLGVADAEPAKSLGHWVLLMSMKLADLRASALGLMSDLVSILIEQIREAITRWSIEEIIRRLIDHLSHRLRR